MFLTADEWDAMQADRRAYSTLDVESYSRARRNSQMNRMYYDSWVNRLFAEIPRSHAGRLLELMSGEGEMSRRGTGRFSAIFAVDLDDRFVTNLARDLRLQGIQGVRPICANAARVPLGDGTIDAVAIMGGLHHARPILSKVMEEIFRVLKPSGILVASEPANDHWLIKRIRHWQYAHSRLQGHDSMEDGFTEDEISHVLTESGFRLESYKVFGFAAYPLMGNTDLIPLLANSKWSALGKSLLRIDQALERIPYIQRMAWASLFRAVKRGAA